MTLLCGLCGYPVKVRDPDGAKFVSVRTMACETCGKVAKIRIDLTYGEPVITTLCST